ncbi:MAG: permease-like cell division protein FtsX [Oscillospiraceae bacterium]
MKSNNVTYLIKRGISSVWKNFVMSFACFCVLAVSLVLVSCTVLMMMNVSIVMGNIEDTNEITIYLDDDVTQAQIDHIGDVLNSNKNLTDIRYYSKEQALEDFREDMGEYAELLDLLEDNPMPETYRARVAELSKIRSVVNAIESIDGVEQAKAPYEFAGVLVNIRNTFTIILLCLLAAMITVSIIIVINSIKSSVFTRRNEISIMKYVGATNAFIKWPFFVEGTFIGILSGAAAWGATWLICDSIYSLFTADVALWTMFGFYGMIPFGDIMWFVLAADCAAGALLGALGSVISTNKYLRV